MSADKKAERTVKPMDPMLRATSKLDRILSEMPMEYRRWAIAFFTQKYCADSVTIQFPETNGQAS